MTTKSIALYIDHNSPYSYLAIEPAWELERDLNVTIDWLPYILDISDYLGSTEVGDDGAMISESRIAHQWRRVKFSYMDARRYANLRGLTLRGPRKIWDSSFSELIIEVCVAIFRKVVSQSRRRTVSRGNGLGAGRQIESHCVK